MPLWIERPSATQGASDLAMTQTASRLRVRLPTQFEFPKDECSDMIENHSPLHLRLYVASRVLVEVVPSWDVCAATGAIRADTSATPRIGYLPGWMRRQRR